MKTFSSTSQNVVYADVNGNIGLYCCAGIPIRKGNGIVILPGQTDEFDWKGYVPFEELPHVYNPPCGYVISANCRVAAEDYPYYISSWYYPPLRFNRIKQLIEADSKHTVSKPFKAILNLCCQDRYCHRSWKL
jgi:penicillin amidase